jgi:hypothetical protein
VAVGLSDCLHYKGTAEGNVKICHVLAIQENEMMERLPLHHQENLTLKYHLPGSFINKLALKAGWYLNRSPDALSIFWLGMKQSQRQGEAILCNISSILITKQCLVPLASNSLQVILYLSSE